MQSRTPLKILLCLLGSVVAWAAEPTTKSTTQPTTQPVAIDWSEAAKHVGETAAVTGPVVSTHATSNGKNLVLNVGKDYPDNSRFTVMLPVPADAAKADDTYKGKTITVTGKIETYKKTIEIKAAATDVVVK